MDLKRIFRDKPGQGLLYGLAIADAVVVGFFDLTRSHWATRTADATHTFRRYYRRGVHSGAWYWTPTLGKFLQYGYIFVLIVIIICLGVIKLLDSARASRRR